MSGLIVYIAIQDKGKSFDPYLPFWVRWIQQHYPLWAVVGLDNHSEPSSRFYIQKAIAENEHTVLLVDNRSGEDAPLGGVFALLQQTIRERLEQTSVVLHGRHRIVERMGAALRQFYQTASEEETKKVLNSILRK